MKVGSVLFVLSVLFFVGGLFFWGFHSCDRTPLDVLTVGRVKGSFLGSSSDLHDGFNWDLAQFLGLKLHKKIVFKELDGSHLISALKANEVDVVCSSLSITDERMKEVAMVHLFAAPYPFIQLLFCFWDINRH